MDTAQQPPSVAIWVHPAALLHTDALTELHTSAGYLRQIRIVRPMLSICHQQHPTGEGLNCIYMHLSSHPMAVMGTCIRTSSHTCDCGAAPAIRTIAGNEKGDTSVDHLPPAASRWYVVLRFLCSHGLRLPSRAHGVVASDPLRMRKALGSNPSVSRGQSFTRKKKNKEKLAAKKVCARSSAC